MTDREYVTTRITDLAGELEHLDAPGVIWIPDAERLQQVAEWLRVIAAQIDDGVDGFPGLHVRGLGEGECAPVSAQCLVGSLEERMTALCRTVPYLADKPGFGLGWDTSEAFPGEPNDAGDYPLPGWATGSSAAREAVVFGRHVWNADNPAPSLAYWDRHHRRAFLAWASDPWWG